MRPLRTDSGCNRVRHSDMKRLEAEGRGVTNLTFDILPVRCESKVEYRLVIQSGRKEEIKTDRNR